MEKFAFIIHPLDAKRDIARKYPFVKHLPESVVEWGLKHKSPMEVSHITGIVSATGAEAEGWFVGCPLSAKQILELPLDFVYEKIIAAGKLAEERGAKIVGLGAFTSVAGDKGRTIAENLGIAVTTGNSYTIATGIEGALKAAEMMDIDLSNAAAAVVGAAGSIGRTCSEILADEVASLRLVGLAADPLEEIARSLSAKRASVEVFSDVSKGLNGADIVISVSSAVDAIIHPEHLKPGSVVCDIARPRDVSAKVAQERDDVLVIDGGVVEVPGPVDFGFDFGFPPKTAYACMSETIALALEGRYESFSLGGDLTVSQVREISAIARKHGFKLAGFRSFEKAVTEEQIQAIRNRSKAKCAC